MVKIAWKCNKCGVEGKHEVNKNRDSMWETVYALEEQHNDLNPECVYDKNQIKSWFEP